MQEWHERNDIYETVVTFRVRSMRNPSRPLPLMEIRQLQVPICNATIAGMHIPCMITDFSSEEFTTILKISFFALVNNKRPWLDTVIDILKSYCADVEVVSQTSLPYSRVKGISWRLLEDKINRISQMHKRKEIDFDTWSGLYDKYYRELKDDGSI